MVEDGVHQVRLFRAPIWRPSGGGGTREARGTVAESLVYRMSTYQIQRGRRVARSSMSQESAEPLCARFKGANRDVSEGRAGLGLFASYEGQQERRTGKISGAFFRDAQDLGGSMLARAPASPAQDFHHHGSLYFNFPYFCITCGLEKLGLVDQN